MIGVIALEKIGQYIKHQREELGFSIEEMSKKTKISHTQLKEIENGNLNFFAEDITYLPFMIRRYAKALYIDFEEIREEVDGLAEKFHVTKKMQKIEEHKEIERSIAKRTKNTFKSTQTIAPKKATKKLEFSQISLIFIVLVIIMSLVFMFVSVILPMLNSEPESENTNPIVELPENPNEQEPEEEPEEEPTENPESVLVINQSSPTEYLISNYQENEEVKISLAFNTPTWVRVYEDNEATENPQSKVYQPDETIDVITQAADNHKIMFHVGIVRSNVFSINDKVVELDSDVVNVTYGIRITFEFAGE